MTESDTEMEIGETYDGARKVVSDLLDADFDISWYAPLSSVKQHKPTVRIHIRQKDLFRAQDLVTHPLLEVYKFRLKSAHLSSNQSSIDVDSHYHIGIREFLSSFYKANNDIPDTLVFKAKNQFLKIGLEVVVESTSAESKNLPLISVGKEHIPMLNYTQQKIDRESKQ